MRIVILFVCTILCMLSLATQDVQAVENPLEKPNNFFGIHILFPEEIDQAANLVNGNGGEWGYVLIPIRTIDRDLEKWQNFMDEAKSRKVIPIVRIATEPYHQNTATWRQPHKFDAVDYANFLNSLSWPTKNKYVIIYNEVNRFDEWGGANPNPKEYADDLEQATRVFKQRDEDFYIIMGGLDNAAPNDGQHMNNYTFLEEIAGYKPEVFNQIDAFSSHSYPNPAFAQPPNEGKMSVATYRYEYDFINSFTDEKKPAFITETGWDARVVSEDKIASYYQQTLDTIWGKDRDKIVAITPFLLNSHGGFDQFAFSKNGQPTAFYNTFKNYPKKKGNPVLETGKKIAGYTTEKKPIEEFDYIKDSLFTYAQVPEVVKEFGRRLLGIRK